MNILLINPPFIFDKKSEIILSHCLGILQIAANLREQGHEVHILDALQEGIGRQKKLAKYAIRTGLGNEEILRRIPEGLDMIALSVPFSHLAKLSHGLAEEIKLAHPDTALIMGGVYPSTQPELAVGSAADYLSLGEGEYPLHWLTEYIEGKRDELPEGIVATKNGYQGEKSYYHPDISDYPLPARDLVDFEQYVVRSPRNVRGWRSASIITSKGCPYNCEFCSVHPVCGYKWRPYPAPRVLAEINHLVDTYQVDNIEIEDDNFTIDQERVEEILKGIIKINEEKQPLSWQALNGLRIDTLNEELIRLFSQSNCRHLNIALEHGDEDMLLRIGKRLDLDRVLEVVRLLKKYEIESHVFTIYGYPGESRERFENALRFYKKIKELAPNIVFKFFITQPYPNTRLFRRCVKEGYLPADVFSDVSKISSFSTSGRVWIETPDFDAREVARRRKVLRKTLFTPKEYAMQMVREKMPDFIVDRLYSLYHKLARRKR